MKKNLLTISFFAFFCFLVVQADVPFHSLFFVHNEEAETVSADLTAETLYEKLEEASKEWNEPPKDAVIDKVWKAIPGYNGTMVNVKESYEAMKKTGEFRESHLVMEEVPPEVHLSDLPPAPIYKGNPAKPAASIMVNVSWGEEYIPRMLKILREEKVKATFFLEGKWVQKQPKLAKMIKEEGHEIGSHAYSHPDMSQSGSTKIRQELKQTNEVLEAVLAEKPALFAPPSGSYNDETVETAAEFEMHTVLWTVDTVDWKNPEPAAMASKTASKVENGSLILMHPTPSAVGGLKEMIQQIKEKGIKLDTVSQTFKETRID
ncbi:polysaccharide deacetylase family protein [Salibacterium aidingense]|uniref:polysaccharide deacetylase family protein n=1 Tax=Salibacterium aidingense TaxID=384933 RepID=UPI000419E75C|nr:polysaccharide deacetylase family protein [Salibacterium aidingense]